MRKLFAVTVCFALLVAFHMPVAAAEQAQVDYELSDKMFINEMYDIFLNAGDYEGKVIKYSGYFGVTQKDGKTTYSVYRDGPACCADDVTIGLDVTWNGEYPNDKEWVEAVGVFESYKNENDKYNRYRLNLSSLSVIARQ